MASAANWRLTLPSSGPAYGGPLKSNVRAHMTRWPSLKQVLAAWATLAACAYCAYVFYMHSLPPDELVMASTLSFQAMIGLVVVGLPAIVFLFLFLFIGAIAKHWLVDSKTSSEK